MSIFIWKCLLLWVSLPKHLELCYMLLAGVCLAFFCSQLNSVLIVLRVTLCKLVYIWLYSLSGLSPSAWGHGKQVSEVRRPHHVKTCDCASNPRAPMLDTFFFLFFFTPAVKRSQHDKRFMKCEPTRPSWNPVKFCFKGRVEYLPFAPINSFFMFLLKVNRPTYVCVHV